MPVPEKITIDGKEYTIAEAKELLDLVAEVRKDEKDKLYSKISGLEAKVKTLENEKKQEGDLSTTKEAELKKLQDELAVAKSKVEELVAESKKAGEGKGKGGKKKPEDGDGDGKDSEPTASGLTAEQVQKMLDDALAKKDADHKRELDEVKKGLNTKNVSDYRKEQLAKYKGTLIEDFVREDLNTQEEVDKAIADAIQKSKPYIRKEYELADGKKQNMSIAEYEEYEEKNRSSKGNNGEGSGGTPTYTPPAKPDGGSGDLTGKELLKDIENMSQEEYDKNYDKILKEAATVKYGDTE